VVEEINTEDRDPPIVHAPDIPVRNFRAALSSGKTADLASKLLKDQVASTFAFSRSNISPDDITQRKMRAE
jgi:hypothetical protein